MSEDPTIIFTNFMHDQHCILSSTLNKHARNMDIPENENAFQIAFRNDKKSGMFAQSYIEIAVPTHETNPAARGIEAVALAAVTPFTSPVTISYAPAPTA